MNIINAIGKYKQKNREWYQRAESGIQWIPVHHTADTFSGTDDQVLQKEANAHIANGWVGLSYHFFILKNGNIYQINKFTDVTWHDTVNWDSLGIALQGYFHTPSNEKPTDKQLQSLRWLLDQLCTQYPNFPAEQKNVLGHRERTATACPGDNLIGFVQDYRNKLGKVDWGIVPTTPPPTDYQKLYNELKVKYDELNNSFAAYKLEYVYKKSDLDSKILEAKNQGIVEGTKQGLIEGKTDTLNKINSYIKTI